MKKWTVVGIVIAAFCATCLYGSRVLAGGESSPWSRMFSTTPTLACGPLKESLRGADTHTGKMKSYTANAASPAMSGGEYNPSALVDPEWPVECSFEFDQCGIKGKIRKHESAPDKVNSSTILLCDAVKSAFLADKEVKVAYRSFHDLSSTLYVFMVTIGE